MQVCVISDCDSGLFNRELNRWLQDGAVLVPGGLHICDTFLVAIVETDPTRIKEIYGRVGHGDCKSSEN